MYVYMVAMYCLYREHGQICRLSSDEDDWVVLGQPLEEAAKGYARL